MQGSGRSVLGAGAPGFEPGITGPKPVALPLGHAPSSAVARGRIEYTSGGAQVDFEPKPVTPAARRALCVVVAREAEPGRVLRDDREHGEVGAAGRAGNGDLRRPLRPFEDHDGEQPVHLVADAGRVGAELDEDLGGHAAVTNDQTEQEVLAVASPRASATIRLACGVNGIWPTTGRSPAPTVRRTWSRAASLRIP